MYAGGSLFLAFTICPVRATLVVIEDVKIMFLWCLTLLQLWCPGFLCGLWCVLCPYVGVDSSTSARVPVSVSVAGKCVIGLAYLPSPYAVCVPLSLQPGLR